MSRRSDEIQAMLQPVVESLGYEFWGLEYIQGRGATLRIYIDRDSDEGISVDDCALVSHQVSGVLDVEDPISGEYNLEVSSPGMERPLFTIEQWARYAGEDIQIRLLAPVAGKRRLTATLTAIEGDDVLLDVKGEALRVPFAQVDRANLVAKFD
ncbi:ribosome maturation factor RimP [Alcanivorax sp. 1008]|uniref:ribosome maturation factor RimP n=1 Tax=Alcanivorax sp. 1008 TaxID=2816853 RepID=UPI001DA23742|nr:ribosome maturation factor RimP [Alcanivorax sp. 1008]